MSGPSYRQLNQLHELFESGGDVLSATQPPECPMEYINVVKTGDGQFQVDAKGRKAKQAEKTKHFQNKEEYDEFWKFMEENLTGFSTCVNPVKSGTSTKTGTIVSEEEAPGLGVSFEKTIKQPLGCPFTQSTVIRQPNGRIKLLNDADSPLEMEESEYKQFWQKSLNQTCRDPMTVSDLLTEEEEQPRIPVTGVPTETEEITKIDDKYMDDLLQPEETKSRTDSYLDNLFDTSPQPSTGGIFSGISGRLGSVSLSADTTQITAMLTIEYLARMIILFMLIYVFTGVIPKEPLSETTKLTIAAVVVLIYMFFDLIKKLFLKIKVYLCKWACGC
jgi:hypothetical protein